MLARGLLVASALLCPVLAQQLELRALEILNSKCTGCHGAAQMSGLDLRSPQSFAKGGTRGPAKGWIAKAIRGEAGLQMPPGKTPLKPTEIAVLNDWLAAGAPYPKTTNQQSNQWWSFQKITRPKTHQSIDQFLNATLAEKKLTPVNKADKRTLIRRATYDLHGLPPTPAEIEAFEADNTPTAYANLIDKLLKSERYGERWGRRWLDVARYAETGGYETDVSFTNAWRYRDYVIRAFNTDKPYNEFMREQIAADELHPGDLERDGGFFIPKEKLDRLEKWIATGLYTVGPVNYEFALSGDQFRVEWQADAVETTGSAFLGLTLGCARCHDHKFDPIPQKDYYRLAAIFAGSEDREIPIVGRYGIFAYTRFYPRQQAVDQLKERIQKMPKSDPARDIALRRLGEAYLKAPTKIDTATILAHTEIVPDTHILARGEFSNKGDIVQPGTLTAIPPATDIREPAEKPFIPQRRKALAEWIASPENPLPARVMANRIWQGHFGRGLVATPNDFGRQGDPPSHPDLLNFLAAELIANNWSVKSLHRQIMLSDAYQRQSSPNEANSKIDPNNTYLWRMNRRRLEAEELRDAVLQTAGQLNTKMYGPPVVLPLSKEEFLGIREPELWPISQDPAEHTRRSVYLYVKRSFKMPMLETFDVPDPTMSCARRESSTVAPQALAMMNGDFTRAYATKMADRFKGPNAVEASWRHALGRKPTTAETAKAQSFLERNTLADLCLLILNMNEFLYVD